MVQRMLKTGHPESFRGPQEAHILSNILKFPHFTLTIIFFCHKNFGKVFMVFFEII